MKNFRLYVLFVLMPATAVVIISFVVPAVPVDVVNDPCADTFWSDSRTVTACLREVRTVCEMRNQ